MALQPYDRADSGRSRHASAPASDDDARSTRQASCAAASRPESRRNGARASLDPGKPATPLSVGDARRLVNVLVAAVGIVLTAPLMLVITILIKLSGPGPILYTQKRVGLDERRSRRQGLPDERRNGDMGGRPFRIYKFRTMQVGSDRHQVWASPDDPRVTGIGRILRCTRLDELPQLFNVLKGEMNVVGPRPEQPEIFAKLRVEVPEYQRRQAVLPGITGWAQVNHCYDRSVDDVREKVSLDLEYIGRASLKQDLRIMLRTPGVMLGRDGGW